jgi:hypothetical protein
VSRDESRRLVHGIGIPVVSALFIALVLWAMSRILLAVSPDVAPWVALGFAANVLAASAAAALLRGRRAFVVITVVVVAILAGGIAGAVVGEYPVESHVAEGEGPGGEPGGEPGGPPPETCEPDGSDLRIAAPPGADVDGFDTECLAVPAEEPFTVEFVNDDVVPHNWALYGDPSAAEHLGGGTVDEPIAPGDTTTYEVDPVDPAEYFYRCDFHPTTMTGTLVVE